ncbi:MAG: TRAP transporter small permease [Pseudomonadota bacterium]
MKRLVFFINRLEEGFLAFTLLGLALMSFTEVVLRYVFNHSFTWFEEFSRYVSVLITFLGASLGVKYGLHFAMDFFVEKAGFRLGNLMRVVSNLLCATLFVVIAWYGFTHVGKFMRFGTTSAAMGLPMYWAYLPIPIFSVLMALRFLHQAWRHGVGMVRNVRVMNLTPPKIGEEA